jgi:two-component system NtrC family response regulator
MATIFIIDDSGRISPHFDEQARSQGHDLVRFANLAEALTHPAAQKTDVIFLDAQLPDVDVVDALRALERLHSSPEVIVLNSPGNPEEAEGTIKNGAWDYIHYPLTFSAFALMLSRVLSYRTQRARIARAYRKFTFEGVEGTSHAMATCLAHAAQAADSDANVLLLGETGVGKELLADAIHNSSARAGGNFVVVDCAAIPESLAESTLLGYEKGAFTGADKPHIGLVKQADGGTLFLDEVSEIPLSIQGAFLRVLDERRFRPVGATNEVTSNFRIIAASNRDLQTMVREGQFRKDLLFRIRAFTIEIPPLRERMEDIESLMRHYVPLLCGRMNLAPKTVSPDFVEAAKKYPWPGNVRELISAIERSIAAASAEPTLFPAHLPTYIRADIARAAATDRPEQDDGTKEQAAKIARGLPTMQKTRQKAIREAEKKYLQDLMQTVGKDIAEACKLSGLSRSRLYALLKKHSIPLS